MSFISWEYVPPNDILSHPQCWLNIEIYRVLTPHYETFYILSLDGHAWLLSNVKFWVEDFFKFCGLLKISELWKKYNFSKYFFSLNCKVVSFVGSTSESFKEKPPRTIFPKRQPKTLKFVSITIGLCFQTALINQTKTLLPTTSFWWSWNAWTTNSNQRSFKEWQIRG